MHTMPPIFYYANILKYVASATAAVYILSGNHTHGLTMQLCVLVLIAIKWLSALARYFGMV